MWIFSKWTLLAEAWTRAAATTSARRPRARGFGNRMPTALSCEGNKRLLRVAGRVGQTVFSIRRAVGARHGVVAREQRRREGVLAVLAAVAVAQHHQFFKLGRLLGARFSWCEDHH